MPSTHEAVMARIQSLYKMLFEHSGYGEMSIEIRFLRKHEKEVLVKCGKHYRFVVPCDCSASEDRPCHDLVASKTADEKNRADVASARTE